MEVALGALPSLLPKLAGLLVAGYNLQKEVKAGIMFLQAELGTMKAALEDISKTPADQLSSQDKIWAMNVKELSYDIEDHIDTFMVQVKGHELAKKHGFFKNFIDKTLVSLMQPKIHRKIATDIRAIRSHVIEVHERRRRYEVNLISVDKPIKVDPRALVLYEDMRKLVGIDEARDEVIKILIEGNEVSKVKDKIVSIVGFGGLGKTTLANVVYQKLKAQFDCSAFVSVSQTPDMDKLFKDMFHQLAKYKATSINVINELREFLQDKRYEYIKKTIHQFIICIFFFSKMVVVIKVKDLDLTRLTENLWLTLTPPKSIHFSLFPINHLF
jgi:uridine kinase